MTPERLQEIREQFDKAIDLVCDLAAGSARWKMSVPANEDKDTDLILTGALAVAMSLLTEIEHITAENEKLRRGQGTAPAPREPGPITVTPIPDSRRTP